MNKTERAFRKIYPRTQKSLWYPKEEHFQLPAVPAESVNAVKREFDEICQWAGIPEGWIPELWDTAAVIRGDEDLREVYNLAAGLLLGEEEAYDAKLFRYWPDPTDAMGDRASLFFLLISLECIPQIRATHRSRDIPEKISRETCSGIGSKAKDYHFICGSPGMRKQSIYWLQNYMKGDLYRCGRLEYMICDASIHAYRNPENQEVRIVLKSPEDGGWISPTEDGKKENPVDPDSFSKWECCVQPGDKVLEMHIPGGGGLTPQAVKESFKDGMDFFGSLYPDLDIRGIVCESWIFSPDLEEVYPADSNLVLFKKLVHLYPVETEDVEGIEFIFGSGMENAENWPQNTSIQRNLKHHLMSGGRFREGAMVFLKDEITGI